MNQNSSFLMQQSVLKSHMANIDQCIIYEELLTPADIEQEFNITGGHWHHGEFTLDQFMFVRPVAGSSQYEMPINGLFLCGAGLWKKCCSSYLRKGVIEIQFVCC